MKIASVEALHADAGQRTFDFLKITTDDGLVGWSEYNESFGGVGVTAVIEGLVPQIRGKDPRAYAKALGIPVYELLGGPIRDRIRVYWSHCGTYRLQWWKEMELPPLRTLDDVVTLGKEVVAKGYTALKTNAFMLGADPYLHSPGFARRGPGFPELNAERPALKAMRDQTSSRSSTRARWTWPSWTRRGTGWRSR